MITPALGTQPLGGFCGLGLLGPRAAVVVVAVILVAAVTVALIDEAEAGEGEVFVHLRDVAAARGDEAREAASGDGAGVGAELGDHAREDAVDQADVAVVEADLEVVHRASADDLGGLADIDAGQTGGPGEEGIGGDAEARRDGSAEELAAAGDTVEGGG